MDRRSFLRSISLAPLAAACGPDVAPAVDSGIPSDAGPTDSGDGDVEASLPRLGPYLCDPRPEAMGFYLEATTDVPPSLVVTPVEGGPSISATFTLDAARIGRVDVDALLPGTTYVYDLYSAGVVVAGGTFRTPPATRSSIVRLAISADIQVDSKPYVVFDRIQESDPDVVLMLGDQVYADRPASSLVAPTEQAYRALYPLHWDDDALADCWANIPALLMWDDHEIVNDYGAGPGERFAAAEIAFEAYQGRRNPAPYRPGVHYFTASLGPVDLFVLDTRTYRSPNHALDDPTKTMLGPQQREDLEAWLLASHAPIKIIASPTPFHSYATTGVDAWAHGFLTERDLLFDFLRDEAIEGVVLVSGDQHWPGAFRHDLGNGIALTELQCTPVAAHLRPPPTTFPREEMLFVDTGRGFGLLEVDATSTPPTVSFAWIDAAGTTRAELDIDLSGG